MEIRKVIEDEHGCESFPLHYEGEFHFYGVYAGTPQMSIKDFDTLAEAEEFMKIEEGTVLKIDERHETLSAVYTVKEVSEDRRGKKTYKLSGDLWSYMLDRRVAEDSDLLSDAIRLPPVGSLIEFKNKLYKIVSYTRKRIQANEGFFSYEEIFLLNLVQKP